MKPATAARKARQSKFTELNRKLRQEQQPERNVALAENATDIRARAREQQRAEERRKDAELARQRYAEQVRKALERADNQIEAPDHHVWQMLYSASSTAEEVADVLNVTPGTLVNWMRSTAQAVEYEKWKSGRTLIEYMAGRRMAQDDTRDPGHKAVELQAIKIVGDALGRTEFGPKAEAAVPAAPRVIDVSRLDFDKRQQLRELLMEAMKPAALGMDGEWSGDGEAIEGEARPAG